MSQLATVARLRRRLTKNRLATLAPKRRFTSLLLILGGIVALLVGGHFAAPALMEPPLDLATPRGLSPDDLPAGQAALEASFWLTVLLATVLNFRILELLFRRPDIVALQPLPIQPQALFADRLITTFIEAVVAAAAASLFFLPLVWHGGAAAALASAVMLLGGLLFGASVSMMLMLVATQRLVPQQIDSEQSSRSHPMLSDAYGGPGQILLYAPGVALGGVIVLALFWKLLLGEPLRLGAFNEPFWIGSAVIFAVVAGCLFVAYRAFVTDYYAMAPRFHEADSTDFSAIADYQESSFQNESPWELGLGRSAARVCRALLLDDDRRMAGGRVGYAVVIALAIVAMLITDLEAMPLWAVAILPATLIAAVVNPWQRLSERARLLDDPLGLPLTAVDRRIAADRVAIREFLFVAAPYATAAAVILGYFRGAGADGVLAAAASIAVGLGVAAGVTLIRRLGIYHTATRWLPPVFLVLMATLTIISLTAAVAVGFAAYLVAIAVSTLDRRSHATV